jgi:hypothetical protein
LKDFPFLRFLRDFCGFCVERSVDRPRVRYTDR